jgi:Beta-galactosidase
MRNKILVVIILLSSISSGLFSQNNNDRIPGIFPKEACGVWCWYSWGGTPNRWNGKIEASETYSKLRGIPIVIGWNELEPKEGVVNWTLMDDIIKKAAAHHKYVFTLLWLNPTEPDWLYENGVPKVEIKTYKTDKNFSYNAYPLDPKYKYFSERIITQMANHLRSLPDSLFKYILFHQVVEGSTGDGYCYKGDPVDPKYAIDKTSVWPAYEEYIRKFTINAYANKSSGLPEIPLLIHTEDMEWAAKEYPGFVNKKGVASHFYGMNDTKNKNNIFKPWDTDKNELHRPVFSRGEGETMWNHKWFVKDSLQNLYWSALYALDAGLDIWNIPQNVLENPKLHPALDIFDKYAGYKYPENSPVAFCALRDQLNADDKIRFPEEKFGVASKKNTDRVVKICAAFANHGAIVEDLEKSLAGSLASRNRKGYNDVGWNCEDDDYNLYLHPIDKVQTSVGWWHIGPKGVPYGLSARGFEHATGKDSLFFKFHDDFFKSTPVKTLTFRIVWLDNNKGTWSFCYDAGGKVLKSAKTFTGKGTNSWREETVTVSDAVMKKNGPRGSDIALINTGKTDFIFHIIEVERK